jgi:hypothetical protein
MRGRAARCRLRRASNANRITPDPAIPAQSPHPITGTLIPAAQAVQQRP